MAESLCPPVANPWVPIGNIEAMRPAYSVLILTTLIGTAQGLVLALAGVELAGRAGAVLLPTTFLLAGAALALALSAAGLVASFFHLGHPERAWRAAAGWRTSWLSREVIVLPAFMGAVAIYGLARWTGHEAALLLVLLSSLLALALFVCTGMIYAAVKVIREWASPYTVVNFVLLGGASGLTLAAALAAVTASDVAPELAPTLGRLALLATLLAGASRLAAQWRNALLVAKTTLQTAIGVRHPRIVQRSQGAMGGSFQTKEFFHGRTSAQVQRIGWVALLAGLLLPLLLLAGGSGAALLTGLAFVLQYLGLLAERWLFFAQARHPQNLYHQTIG